MPKLPQRPRSHQLEAESRTAFRHRMERQGWVVRAVDSPDYGLDDQVEIFVDGEATGLLFYVQVRGTDASNLEGALAVRVRKQQQAYFDAIGHPVLVVRYLSEGGRLFARWFHRFDPHPRRAGEVLRIYEEDELDDARVAALASEVRLYRMVSAAALAWPLPVRVASAVGIDDADAAIAMQAVAGNQPFVVFVPASDDTDAVGFTIELLPDRMVVHGGLSSLTMHGETAPRSLEDLAADVVLGCGIVLGMLGHLEAAAKLIAAAAPYAPSLRDDLLMSAAAVLSRGKRIREALDIAGVLVADGRRTEARLLVGTVGLAMPDLLSPDEIRAVVEFQIEAAEAAEVEGAYSEAATIRYSLGNWLFNTVHDWEGALGEFETARDLDPSYGERSYFVWEHAAALFECGRYDDAAEAYDSIASMDEHDHRVLALRGDALLLGGRYLEALQAFRRYLEVDDEPMQVWKLKAAVADLIVSNGFTIQQRDPVAAEDVLAGLRDEMTSDQVVEICRRALKADALSPLGWAGADDEGRSAGLRMLPAALEVRIPDVWASVFLQLLHDEEESLAQDISAHAVREAGAAFVDAVRRAGMEFPTDVAREGSKLARSAWFALPELERGYTLRIPEDDGEVVEYRIGADD